ncbi:conserved hypothetical protein [Ricinus communis]|uniref:Oxidoreductase n=1 Tax=Ricinus communis TaxID=3988 RepID=B9SZ52_RICCO|nr:conserved hypothetical protein [Ricinus communis]
MSNFAHSLSSLSSLSSITFQPIKIPLKSSTSTATKSSKALTLTCTTTSQPNKRPTSKNRKKSSYGTSRRSVLKKTFSQEQVNFSFPVSDDPHVGIIGGGMAGLVCAVNLEKRGVKSTVFDTGNHGLGGRMGTRVIDPQPLVFDHAAQFFTVSDPQFAQLVDGWLEKGLIRQWQGTIGELEKGGHSLTYSGCLLQTSMVEVVRPCWISRLEPFNGMWHLSENGKPCGQFDVIVIAHNGKCANRLLASSGLPLIARQMKKLDLSPIWALLAAFEEPLPIPSGASPFEGAFVKGVDSISWMGNNSMKLFSQSNGPHCWTFFSTAAFGKRNKVPQENIPNSTAEKVKAAMLEGVEVALGLAEGSLKLPFYSRVQLWGAALPRNSPGVACIFDPNGRAGICGDWLLGSNLESAALSGMALANHIGDYIESGGAGGEEFGMGLHADFHTLEGHHDIGQFSDFILEAHPYHLAT